MWRGLYCLVLSCLYGVGRFVLHLRAVVAEKRLEVSQGLHLQPTGSYMVVDDISLAVDDDSKSWVSHPESSYR